MNNCITSLFKYTIVTHYYTFYILTFTSCICTFSLFLSVLCLLIFFTSISLISSFLYTSLQHIFHIELSQYNEEGVNGADIVIQDTQPLLVQNINIIFIFLSFLRIVFSLVLRVYFTCLMIKVLFHVQLMQAFCTN